MKGSTLTEDDREIKAAFGMQSFDILVPQQPLFDGTTIPCHPVIQHHTQKK